MLTLKLKRLLTLFLYIALSFFVIIALPYSIPPPVVELGLPQTVYTINPKIGVHTRLTDEVEAWKIKYTLQLVREMGSPWLVEYFPWAYHQPSPHRFDWSHSDLVIDHAYQQGLTIIARLGFVPEWARPPETTTSFLSVENYDKFGDYVYAFVKRYQGKVDYIVVWNEPNLSIEWGFQHVDPVGYTELLRIAYYRAKEANPNVQVLGGALAPTIAPKGDEFALNDLIYLQEMLTAGAGEFMDALAVHAYGWVYPVDDPPQADVVNFQRTVLIRHMLVENSYAHIPIHITEGGWNDHPRWIRAVKPGQRITYTIQAYQTAQEWDWLKSVNMWVFRYPRSNHTYLDYFSYVTPEFIAKPIYTEVKQYATN